MEPDAATTDELARRLAAAHLDLAHARDDLGSAAAVARAVLPYGPELLDIHYLDVDAHGAPQHTRPVALWTRDGGAAAHPRLGGSIDLADIPLSVHWIADHQSPLILADLDSDPRCDADLRRRLAPYRALAVLPLYSRHPAGWQGVLTLLWREPHAPDADERLVYRLLMASVAAFIADRRALQDHEAALAEIQALYRISARLSEADDPVTLLAALGEPAFARGSARGSLLAVETGPSGQMENFTVIAVRGPAGPIGPDPGIRYSARDTPLERLLRHNTASLLAVEDVDSDPRLDEVTRNMYHYGGSSAALVIPLRWQGRWVAILSFTWAAPQRFAAGLRRLYASLARQAAAMLDNRLLFASTRQALHENREQHRTLAALLDHLPIGVTVFDADGARVLTNRSGVALLRLGATQEDQNRPQTARTYHPGTDRRIAHSERISQRAIATRQVVRGDIDFDRLDGTRVTVTSVGVPILDEHGAVDRCILLFQDMGQRLAAERERARIQEDIIAAQRAALAERSTPLIPLRDDLLVMPIVGAVDPERGRQIVAALGDLGGRTRVRAAILDLTGVRSVDTEGARALVEAAQVLRLRGVEPIFTGIGGEVAWALVDLDVDLRGLVTCATLRDGIARAARLTTPGPRA